MWKFVTVFALLKTVLAYYEGNVRLVGGHVSHEGRVEVYHNFRWATVCDDSWDLQDAHVVCRQLGFPEALTATQLAFFGEGNSSQAIVTSISCSGDEDRLLECSYSETHFLCGHYEDAGVVCSDGVDVEGKLRLAGGSTPRQGRLEIYHGGEWGTICDDSSWATKDAMVACRQLGFDGVKYTYLFFSGLEERSNHLSDVDCTGHESRIEDCSHSGWGSTCSIGLQADIECSGGPYAQEYDVRLVGGPSLQAGRVEIFHDNSWGTICDDSWSSTEAEVVCDQLGYDEVDVTLEYFGPGDGAIHVSSLSCYGYESSVENCLYVNFGSTGCDHTEDVGIRCEHTSYGYSGSGLSTYVITGIVTSSLVVFSAMVTCVAVLVGRMRRPQNPTAGIAAFTVSGTTYPNGTTAAAPSVTLNPTNPQVPNHPQPAAGNPQFIGYPQVAGYPQAAGYPQGGGYPQSGSYPQSTAYPQSASPPQLPPNYNSVVGPTSNGEKVAVAPSIASTAENPQQPQA